MANILLSHKENFNKTVDEIINSSKYAHLKENLSPEFYERLEDSFNKILPQKRLYSDIGTVSGQGLFFVVFTLLLIILMIYLINTRKKEFVAEERLIYGEILDQKTNYEGLYEKALEREAHGDFKDAVRLHFISILVHMNEKSLWLLDDAKTNQEILAHLKKKGFRKANVFKGMADYFHYVWYGDKQIDSLAFSDYKEKAQEISMEVKDYCEKE